MSNDFMNSAAFRALIADIEQQHGPIEYVTVCNHPEVPECDPVEDGGELVIDSYPDTPKEHLVRCDYCQMDKPIADCMYIGENIGPDMLTYDAYLCDECANDLGEVE
jgi:hypothetical protein